MKNLYEVKFPGATRILYEYLPRPGIGRCRTVEQRCRTEREAYRLLGESGARAPAVVDDTARCLLVDRVDGVSAGKLIEFGSFDGDHARRLGEALASIHAVERSQYGELQGEPVVDAWRPYLDWLLEVTAERADGDPIVSAGIDCLESQVSAVTPAADPVLLHGDYHPWNVVFDDTEPVVLDMEASLGGPPAYDVSQALVEWAAPRGVSAQFLAGYGEFDDPDRLQFYRVLRSVVGVLDGRRADSEELVRTCRRALEDAVGDQGDSRG